MSNPPPRPPIAATLRRLRPLVVVAAAVAVALLLVSAFVSIYTNVLWFRSVHQVGVYQRTLMTEVVMFVLFGGVTALAVALDLTLLHRFTPYDGTAAPGRLPLRLLYARRVYPRRHLLTALVALVAGIDVGLSAARQWPLWLQWRDATPFGIRDPQFHRDYAYYAFVYPLHRYALGVGLSALVLCLALLAVVGYLNGGVRARGDRPRLRRSFRVQLNVLLGLLALLKAAAYWLDRFATTTSSRGVATGASYTDVHAVLPAKFALMVIALVVAAAFFANAFLRSLKVTLAGVAVLVVAGVLLGGVAPWVVQTYHVKPDAAEVERSSIARNIATTRYAYGIGGAAVDNVSDYGTHAVPASDELRQLAGNAFDPQLLDPNQMSPTFTQLQQQRAYYGFKSTLDVDRYDVNGKPTDVVLGARELTLSGLPASQRSWTNTHLVYTHGNGLVAAPASGVDPDGTPHFVEGGLPSSGVLGRYESRIYFGQMSPSYSIVGAPRGAAPRELDRPATNTTPQVNTTYTGTGGVPIGSMLRRLAYAWRMGDKNILFSSGVNSHSRLLYIRDPRQRVQQVAPWLTLDGDAYPIVANGRVLWVIDGYTTLSSLPYSQRVNLQAATRDSYVTNGSTVAQANTNVNYIRNSVKATVDAYDGTVTLYRWDTVTGKPDPVLETWMRAMPGVVHPAQDIPPAVRAHLRYPHDLFDVQRTVLARYHVTDPLAFYNGSDFWLIPSDPTVTGNTAQPPYYVRLDPTGQGTHTAFSLTSPFVSLNGRAMTAYLSVDADPGPGYGKLTLLRLPSDVEGPGQLRNDIESDPTIAQELTLLRGGGSRVVPGNLQTFPVGGHLVSIEPIYSQAAGGTSFPILRRVVVVNNSRIAFEPTLQAALDVAFGARLTGSARVAVLVTAAQQANTRAQAALAAGNHAEYELQQRKLAAALAEIAAATSVTGG